ncbi:hypothetical protein HID58_094824 [Brassica napus]|uniref:Uncharacterized protein n=1 Tax=Brassica napus TaxID=3708 RepID=A0ABQ7X876_BRANA|nr:hypothetical protein HID58_094824 [Brassica napus]
MKLPDYIFSYVLRAKFKYLSWDDDIRSAIKSEGVNGSGGVHGGENFKTSGLDHAPIEGTNGAGLEELREVDSRLVEGRVLQEEHQTVHHHSEVAEEQWSTNEQQNRGCHDSEVADLSFGMEESQVNPCQIEEMREIA